MYDNNNISELGWHDFERNIAVKDDQAGVWWDLMGGWWNLPLEGHRLLQKTAPANSVSDCSRLEAQKVYFR